MHVLRSRLEERSVDYIANRRASQLLLDGVAKEVSTVLEGGGERYVERHRERGKLTVRERVELLLDPDTAFLELSPLAAWGTESAGGGAERIDTVQLTQLGPDRVGISGVRGEEPPDQLKVAINYIGTAT